jgi:predicted DNA-binding protein (UPF0251 family)
MPRPRKERRYRCAFSCQGFKPIGIPTSELERIALQKDEIEALRLCDMKGLTQEQAGTSMKISRGTVQRLLTSAREKVATAIVNGAALIFEDEPQVD